MKRLPILSVAWFVLICGVFVFSTPLAEFLWVGYLAIHWGIVLAGGAILFAAIVAARKDTKAALIAFGIAALGIALFFTVGFRFGRVGLFQLRKAHYETLLSDAMESGEIPRGMGHIDEGPPVRYAFYWQRGVTDNWAAVVHDPTGVVTRVNEIPDMTLLHDERWQDVVTLFGGDMYRCQHIQGAWYICWFT